MDVAFTPQINEFHGHVSVQLLVSALRQHDGGALCKRILDGERGALWAAAAYCPERSDFIRVWHMAEQDGFRLAPTAEGILSSAPAGMAEETYCLCLAVLREVGLLSSPDGAIYGAEKAEIEGKADLENTEIIRALKSI